MIMQEKKGYLSILNGYPFLQVIRTSLGRLMKSNSKVLQTVKQTKYLKKPYNNNDYNNGIQYVFYGALHRDIRVYEP